MPCVAPSAAPPEGLTGLLLLGNSRGDGSSPPGLNDETVASVMSALSCLLALMNWMPCCKLPYGEAPVAGNGGRPPTNRQ